MSLSSMFLIPALLVVLLIVSLYPIYKRVTTGRPARSAALLNLCIFFGACIVSALLPLTAFASVDGTTAVAAAAGTGMASDGMKYLAASISTGLSSLGAGIAVAAAAPAAIGAFSEDPKSFGKSLIFVALGEGVAIYGLLVSILLIFVA